MAGGLFNRLKVWAFEEVLKSKDLNAEFDNIINHLSPQFIASFSQTISQMQLQLDPGGLGTENLAQSDAQEIEQLRFVIARIIGLPFWYQSPAISLQEVQTTLNAAVGLPPSRVISGLSNGISQQAVYLQPSGTTLSVTLKASVLNPFIVFIDGTQYTFNADITLNGLSPAPSANNTAAINDVTFTGQRWTRLMGEQVSAIPVTTAGSEITTRVGQVAAFLNPNIGNEILMARIFSSTSLNSARRGYFFDSTGVPISRDILNNTDLITYLKLSWIFLTSLGALDVTYDEPSYQGTAPLTPNIGDYWFNTSTSKWNKFNGTAWVIASAILIGNTVQNMTACIGARSVDFFRVFQDNNTLRVRLKTATELVTTQAANEASIFGNKIVLNNPLIWDYPLNLDTGLTPTDQEWFFYLTEQGVVKISDQYPYDRLSDLKGWYHPSQTWLCIGGAFVGLPSSALTGQIEGPSVFSFGAMRLEDMPGEYVKDMSMFDVAKPRQGYIPVRQDLFSHLSKTALFRVWAWQGNASGDGSDIGDTNFFNLPQAAGSFDRVVDPGSVVDTTGTRNIANAGGNSGQMTGTQQVDTLQGHGHKKYYSNIVANGVNVGGGESSTLTNTVVNADDIVRQPITDFNGSSGGRGALVSTETRPWNFAYSLWIKT